MLEINISCPNVEHGGIAFGQEPKMVEHITKEVKKTTHLPISMKLTPNVIKSRLHTVVAKLFLCSA